MASLLGPTLFSLALTQIAYGLNTASISNSTTTTTINFTTAVGNLSFTRKPRGRGTMGLIISRTATFWFCVWTAVHPDIIAGITGLSRLVYKANWMLFSIIVPEAIIMFAISQWKQVQRINKKWQQKFPNDRDYLGMDGAFFILMGSFMIDRPTGSRLPENCDTPPYACWCPATRPSQFWIKSQHHSYTATLIPAGFHNYL